MKCLNERRIVKGNLAEQEMEAENERGLDEELDTSIPSAFIQPVLDPS